jgi:arylsulfatase A-like enzyme
MRRDHMALYGYSRATTPALERWASRGLVFEDVTTVSAWTLPSHASMFTGLWPRTHGAHAFSVGPMAEEKDAPENVPVNIYPLALEHVTLAEVAREHGYRTAGFSANHYYLSSKWGMDQGFGATCAARPASPPWGSGERRCSPGG